MPGLATHAPMSAWLQSQAPLQEGIRELGAQARPGIRAAPTPVFLPKESLRCFPVCGGDVGSALWGIEAAWKHGSLLLGHCLSVSSGGKGMLFFADHMMF